MEISNDDLARILGRMEGKLDAQVGSTKRVEEGLANLDVKMTRRLDEHDQRLRDLEVANPKAIAEAVQAHDKRIRALENGAAKAGVIAGVGSSVGIAVIVEVLKRKLGM
jgi:hypothetical protein